MWLNTIVPLHNIPALPNDDYAFYCLSNITGNSGNLH